MTITNNQENVSRRRFVRLGSLLAAGTALGVADFPSAEAQEPSGTARQQTPQELRKVWQKKHGGRSYNKQHRRMPGVTSLEGPGTQVRFPDREKYRNITKVHGMCQLCSTVCGITGLVKNGRIIKVEGNPNDPNSMGKMCARGQAALNHQYHPERLMHPMKRVGPRGSGKWRRITWEQAYREIAAVLAKVRASGRPEEFGFHQGRSRSKDIVANFLRAFGTNTHLNHRGLCSAARRAANLTYLFESDWDLGDYANSKYIINFGSNMFEAHQGHIPGAVRLQRGRFRNGAKLVTFDVRMSNTAGNSDEFFMPFPGTDGAIALAMAHTIISRNLANKQFFTEWANCSIEELWAQLKIYTPEWAEKISTVPANDIRRIAVEFARAAPECTTMCNRGSSAHVNGYWNDRAIILLNVLVGNVGKRGGFNWMYTGGTDNRRFPPPTSVPAPKRPSILADPPEFILANRWRTMKVGEIVYWYLRTGRARLQAYMTYNLDSPLTWPEMDVTENVLLDHKKIGYHVCINPFYNETAHYADIVLPWTTFMERWDVDARGAYNLKPYLSMRRPMVEALGEAKDLREVLPELARRIGGGMEKWFPRNQSVEDYMTAWTRTVPFNGAAFRNPMDMLEKLGAFEDPQERQNYEPYLKPLTKKDMQGARVDKKTGVITKDGKGIGIMHRGGPVRGFRTPSRKLEVKSDFVVKAAANEDLTSLINLANSVGKNRPAHHKKHSYKLSPWPVYVQITEHQKLEKDELIMTSFKWNVHNHGRTANLKWLAEIVHSNPAWIHPETAKRFGLRDGDWIEIRGHRSESVHNAMPGLKLGTGEVGRRLRIPIVVTEGVHPKALAISNSLGHFHYTNVAQAKKKTPVGGERISLEMANFRDPDWEQNMWWEDNSGGNPKKWRQNTGPGWAQNNVLAIMPDYISGQQSFNDTVVTVRKIT